MSSSGSNSFMLPVPDQVPVAVKVDAPARSGPGTPALILAHGASNDLDHPLLARLAAHLTGTESATVVRFNFPYVERGVGSPDRREVLECTMLAVYDHVRSRPETSEAPLAGARRPSVSRTAQAHRHSQPLLCRDPRPLLQSGAAAPATRRPRSPGRPAHRRRGRPFPAAGAQGRARGSGHLRGDSGAGGSLHRAHRGVNGAAAAQAGCEAQAAACGAGA